MDQTRSPEPFLVAMPAQIHTGFDQLVDASRRSYRDGDLEEAIDTMEAAYAFLVEGQPPGRRFHKGYPLHQLGLWELESRDYQAATYRFLLAFVEDSISRAEESPAEWDELARPAAQMLVYTLNTPGPLVANLAGRLRQAFLSRARYTTPEIALEEHPLTPRPSANEEAARSLVEEEPEPFAPEWRRLGDYGTRLEDRVFVGGSYAHEPLLPALRAARDQTRLCGYDGVLVAEFITPQGMGNRTKSLICLMGCRKAIFNLTESGGHQVEFDKLVDFGIRDVLVVYDAELKDYLTISSLTKEWFVQLHVDPKG